MSASKVSVENTPPTIFVVDDEPMLLDLAEMILQPLGFKVQTFRDPKKAMAEFSAAKPSVVITDYAMGETSGIDLLRECRRLNPQQKVILISGTIDESIYSDESLKPDLFLSKPYQVQNLLASVRSMSPAA